MDHETEQLRPRYAFCRAAFYSLAFGLGVYCLDKVIHVLALVALTEGSVDLIQLIESPGWGWVVGTPITLATVLGAYLLWGRWTDAAWQRRAGLLLLMNLVDLAFWGFTHAKDFGWKGGELPHSWLLGSALGAMQWLEFLLAASLAAEVGVHLGADSAARLGEGVRMMSIAGLAFCAISFVVETDWARGWPLGRVPLNRTVVYLWLITWPLEAFTTGLLVILCITAGRNCGQYLRELKVEERGQDLLVSRSEGNHPDFWDRHKGDPRP